MGIRVGIVGTGAFAQEFIPLFRDHPQVDGVVLCDHDAVKLRESAARHGLADTAPSLDAICARDDVDALAIYTQHWMHGPQAVQGLRAGKHVCTAVPPAFSFEQLDELVRTVRETGRTYALMETSSFRRELIWARERYREGAFGQMLYLEGEYFHDWSHGLTDVWAWRYGPGWEDRCGGEMPFSYVTHSAGGIMSVTGAHAVAVSSLGIAVAGDPYFSKSRPHGNDVANQVAMLRMSDGSAAKLCEFRRIGHPEREAFRFYGTEASMENPPYQWSTRTEQQVIDFPAYQDRLPASLVALGSNGHGGSHPHLVHDFVMSIVEGRLPFNHVWAAARYCLPGLVGIESARQGGALLPVPDYGDPPGR